MCTILETKGKIYTTPIISIKFNIMLSLILYDKDIL